MTEKIEANSKNIKKELPRDFSHYQEYFDRLNEKNLIPKDEEDVLQIIEKINFFLDEILPKLKKIASGKIKYTSAINLNQVETSIAQGGLYFDSTNMDGQKIIVVTKDSPSSPTKISITSSRGGFNYPIYLNQPQAIENILSKPELMTAFLMLFHESKTVFENLFNFDVNSNSKEALDYRRLMRKQATKSQAGQKVTADRGLEHLINQSDNGETTGLELETLFASQEKNNLSSFQKLIKKIFGQKKT